MTKAQEAKLNMYRATLTHTEKNAPITGKIKAFQDVMTEVKTNTDSIISTVQLEATVITGEAINKTELKKDLCQKTVDMAAQEYAYASAISDTILKEKSKLSFWELSRLKDDELAPVCRNIVELAQENIANLKDYGVTQASIDAHTAAVDAYSNAVSAPRNAISQRAAYKKTLSDRFAQTDKLLKGQADKLILQFKKTDPEFYEAYKSNRIIVDASTTSTQVKGKITDAATGKALYNIKVEVLGTGASAITNTKGNYVIKALKSGVYKIQTAAEGYNSFTQPEVEVKLGHASVINIELKRA